MDRMLEAYAGQAIEAAAACAWFADARSKPGRLLLLEWIADRRVVVVATSAGSEEPIDQDGAREWYVQTLLPRVTEELGVAPELLGVNGERAELCLLLDLERQHAYALEVELAESLVAADGGAARGRSLVVTVPEISIEVLVRVHPQLELEGRPVDAGELVYSISRPDLDAPLVSLLEEYGIHLADVIGDAGNARAGAGSSSPRGDSQPEPEG